MVSTLSIIFMSIACCFGIGIPVGLILISKKALKNSLKPYFTGSIVFAVFAMLLEGFANVVIVNYLIGPDKIENMPLWLTGLYAGFMAGLFEESGRFIAFKTFLKKDLENKNLPLIYGAGHGGMEVFFILFNGMVLNLVISLMINTTGNITIIPGMDTVLLTTPPYMYLVSVFERLTALAAHILLSVIVWNSAKNKKVVYYLIAILLHALMNFIAVVLKDSVNIFWLECILVLYVSMIGIFVFAIWYKEERENKKQAAE